jgi:ferredoxin-NADP reductase
MEAELHAGRKVWVKMPYGEFTVDAYDACLLAGGTGMTAFSAFLADLPPDFPRDIHLFYGVRYADLLIYRPLIQRAAERCAHLHAHYFVEQGTGCDIQQGQLEPDLIFDALPNPLNLTYYLSGPPAMLTHLSTGLSKRGVAEQSIRVDAWE